MIINQHRIFLALAIILLLGLAAFLMFNSLFVLSNQEKKARFTNSADQKKYEELLKRIREEGGNNAYKEFQIEVHNMNLINQHKNAHLFGEALYEIEGIKGVNVCDDQFNYGCYHSFLGIAINKDGLDIVSKLAEGCSERLGANSSSCPHGIGHGVLSSIGYDFESLKKSLNICDNLGIDDPIKGCYNGVFMEYNFQTMLLDEGKKRAYDRKDPYFPCYVIDNKYANHCILQQSQWWLGAIQSSLENRVKEIDDLCFNLSNQPQKNQCYKGFGSQLLSYTNYIVDTSKNLCDSLNGKKAVLACRAGLAKYMEVIPELKNQAGNICSDLKFNEDDQEFCRTGTL